MKIECVDRNSFKEGRLNILTTADNHGVVSGLPMVAETIRVNTGKIFPKHDSKNTMNVFAMVGDWFINPSKMGFFTNPNFTNGEIQFLFQNKLIEYIKNLLGNIPNFDSIFTIGNHDLDGGDAFMYKVMDEQNKKTVITNVDVDNSPKLQQIMKDNNNIVKSVIYEIPDDKNPTLKHKALCVSATIPSMKFYNPGLLKDMRFFDDCNKRDANIKKEDLTKTVEAIKKEVDEFKQANPKGAVILLSHTGAPISKMIREQIPQINIILNGHDHKKLSSLEGKTSIHSLGENNEIFKAVSLVFDDNGDIKTTDMEMFVPAITVKDKLDENPLKIFLDAMLVKDVKPIVSLKNIDGSEATLDYGESIRYQNSYLANYLTSAIKRGIRSVTNNPDVIVGLPSSIIRGGIKNNSTNMELMKIFDGVSEDLSVVNIGTIKGEELVGLITENIRDNLKNSARNTIIQWSDIQVNRTLIKDILDGNSNKKLQDAIKVRLSESGRDFVSIDPEKIYTIAINDKFLMKDDIEWPLKIRDRFTKIKNNKTYNALFQDYLSEVDYQLLVTNKTKENRVL